jgi:hypothetical protein
MWTYDFTYSDYLMHYGVKGMHWGVRKAVEKAYNNSGLKLHSKTLKKGYNFQNITKNGQARRLSNSNALYVSHTPTDNKTYRNMWWWFGDQPVKNTITATKDVKIAGKSVSQKEFVKLCSEKGKSIASEMGDTKYDFTSQKTLAAKIKGANWVKNEGYKNFVRQYTEGMGSSQKEFNNRLSKKGYDAIYDVYDISEGYSNEPLIFFKPTDSVKVTKSERYKYD